MDFLRSIVPQGLLGAGMANMAAQAMQSRPYQLHLQEMKALGQQPMTYEDWMRMQQQQPQQTGLLGPR